MSMMSEMLGDMLKKALPPEVIELLTPEKVQEFGERANSFINDLRASLTRIEENQQHILERLNNGGYNSCGNGDGSGEYGATFRNGIKRTISDE